MITQQVIGRLGRDAEVRDAGSTKVVNFSIGVNVGYGNNKDTLWIECAKFGEKTTVAEFLKKGTLVYVSGEPGIRTYKKKDGTDATSMTLRVVDVQLLGSKSDNEQQPATAPTAAPHTAPATVPELDSSLPF